MIVSHKHKFIFLKSEKTAGTSLEVSLASVCGPEDIVTTVTKDGLPKRYSHPYRNNDGLNPHALPAKIISEIGIGTWNKYYKILPIRNSWDRAVSYWYWANGKYKKNYTFSEHVKTKQMRLLSKWYKLFPFDKKPCVDFLIRFEHLNEDFLKLCNLLKINPIKLPRAKGNFRTSRKHYAEYYDDETQEIIARKYKKDIEHFGYKFEGGSL